uniref:Uncharacterized protein n=1 Tax=Anguilla anguilla TaxID=7936 RepID=A0A0E9VNZ2_ANGAN
MAPAAAVHRL